MTRKDACNNAPDILQDPLSCRPLERISGPCACNQTNKPTYKQQKQTNQATHPRGPEEANKQTSNEKRQKKADSTSKTIASRLPLFLPLLFCLDVTWLSLACLLVQQLRKHRELSKHLSSCAKQTINQPNQPNQSEGTQRSKQTDKG